jgi:septal ring factor EnvC (AmiA/AmiB activator)
MGVTPARRMAVARSRATARLLLARDRDEAKQLGDETALLAGAVERIDEDLVRAATMVRPAQGSLLRPVDGEVVRRFGTLVHEATGATLSRRGIDFDVADEAVVVAPADGVVRYAGPIRGLESGLVIDHGGVLTVIGKLAPPTLTAGTRVRGGTAVGHAARRRVYLEVRLPIGPGGTPVDPEPLLR